MKNLNVTMLDEIDASSSATGTFIARVDSLQNLSMMAVLSGGSTPSGTAKFQVSNDKPSDSIVNFTPTNWFDLPNASVTFADSGTKGTASIGISHYWLRAVWTVSSASGATLTVVLHANGQA